MLARTPREVNVATEYLEGYDDMNTSTNWIFDSDKTGGYLIDRGRKLFRQYVQPCDRCKTKAVGGGMHPFEGCNVLPSEIGLHKGACSNCMFDGKAMECTRRKGGSVRAGKLKPPTGPSKNMKDFYKGGRRGGGAGRQAAWSHKELQDA